MHCICLDKEAFSPYPSKVPLCKFNFLSKFLAENEQHYKQFKQNANQRPKCKIVQNILHIFHILWYKINGTSNSYIII